MIDTRFSMEGEIKDLLIRVDVVNNGFHIVSVRSGEANDLTSFSELFKNFSDIGSDVHTGSGSLSIWETHIHNHITWLSDIVVCMDQSLIEIED